LVVAGSGQNPNLRLQKITDLSVYSHYYSFTGAVHTVIFAGFSAEAVAARLNDSKAKVIFTADEAIRGKNNRHFIILKYFIYCSLECKQTARGRISLFHLYDHLAN
jgi:hypothetical protein